MSQQIFITPVSYDMAGAASATGYSERTIHDAIRRGDLVAHTLTDGPNSKKVVERDDLLEWVKSLPVWTPAA